MHSFRLLGFVALGALAVAIVSFAVVDVSLSEAAACTGAVGCAAPVGPDGVLALAIVGTIALAASVLPAVGWFAGAVRRPRAVAAWRESDLAVARQALPRPVRADDDF